MRRAILLFFLVAVACSRRQPNVLLITFDTTRADHVGFVTGKKNITPTLDALAASGTGFTTAIASQPLTAPSHATILTGLYPYHHGLRNNGAYTLPDQQVTLAERLRDAGYDTHAIIAAYVLDSRFGFDQGFAGYDDDLSAGSIIGRGEREIGAKQVADKALQWLGVRDAKKPFFLWLHFYDPHARYEPPADIAKTLPGYDGEIHYADRELGRVIAKLREQKQLDDTLVVFTADHGEALGDHGEEGHGYFVYDSTTRVPLFFAGPHVPRGRKLSWIASHVDIVPTILDLLGKPKPSGVDGASLATLWNDDHAPDRRAYSETFAARMNFGWSELRSMRSGGARVIEAPKREAYDETRDRAEAHNLYGAALPADARPMFAQLAAIDHADDYRATTSAVDDETRKQLAALGYITATPSADQTSVDPKDRLATWIAFNRAQSQLQQRDFRGAATALVALAQSEPSSEAIQSLLTMSLAQSGRTAEALAVAKKRVENNPRNASALVAHAGLLRATGKNAEARAVAEAALRIEPDNADAHVALADVAIAEERFADAERVLRDGLRRAPKSSALIAALGDCLNRAGRQDEALAVLQQGRTADPNSHLLAYNLGVLEERTGHPREAMQTYAAAARLDPTHAMTWNNLGSLLNHAGRHREAVACITRARKLDPANVEAAYNLGAILLQLGRAREAIPHLEAAVALRPTFFIARVRLASAVERAGDATRALAMWSDIAKTQPRAWAKVASLELQQGHRDAAIAAIQRGTLLVGAPFTEVVRNDAQLRRLISD